MTRIYSTDLAFKTAVEQRLRNRVEPTGMHLVRLRQLLVFDRYLARVFAVFRDAAILKGGLVLELRLERARATKDIDLRLIGDPDSVLHKLQEAGRMDLGDYLFYKVHPDPRHPVIRAEGLSYEGRRFRGEAVLAGKSYGMPFGIDVAFAEPLVGSPETVEGSRFLSFAGLEPTSFRIYPVEAHIAEKLHAYTLPRERPNTRVKDLPDLALLASSGSIDAGRLRAAIDATFKHRGTHQVPGDFPDPPRSWAPIYASMAEKDDLAWETLDDLMSAVLGFLGPVLEDKPGRWDPGGWAWHSER